MRRYRLILILVILAAGAYCFLFWRSPKLPESANLVKISLMEPYIRTLIVEKEVTDEGIIQSMIEGFSQAKSRIDHKCGSIGTISFITGDKSTVLEVLPGHDSGFYEFRLDGYPYRLPRESYVDMLVGAGIAREDIRLDGHPDINPNIEQGSADEPATAPQLESSDNKNPNPESKPRPQ